MPTQWFPVGKNPHEHLISLTPLLHFTVIFTVKKQALLQARGMDSALRATTPAHQLSTVAANELAWIFG